MRTPLANDVISMPERERVAGSTSVRAGAALTAGLVESLSICAGRDVLPAGGGVTARFARRISLGGCRRTSRRSLWRSHRLRLRRANEPRTVPRRARALTPLPDWQSTALAARAHAVRAGDLSLAGLFRCAKIRFDLDPLVQPQLGPPGVFVDHFGAGGSADRNLSNHASVRWILSFAVSRVRAPWPSPA